MFVGISLQVQFSSVYPTVFTVLAHESLVSRLAALLVMSCLDSSGSGSHCSSHFAATHSPVHPAQPCGQISFAKDPFWTHHTPFFPQIHRTHFFPQWLKNKPLPLHDIAQLTLFSIPCKNLRKSSMFCSDGVQLVSWTHMPFAFLPLCLCSSCCFRLKHFLFYPHLHLLMPCPLGKQL